MKNILKKTIFYLNLIGIDVFKFISIIKGLPFYYRDYIKLKRELKNDTDFSFGKLYNTYFLLIHI